MKVLVTGAAGFLGRAICERLMAEDHQVVALDLVHLHDKLPDAPTKVGAFIQEEIVSGELSVDAVIHLAAIASPAACIKDPGAAFQVNVLGTQNVLKLALQAGAQRFVLASSAHVYGISPRYLPTDEVHPIWNQDTYTLTKVLSENLVDLYYRNYGLSYCAIRLFNGYGVGQLPGYFVPDMIQKAKAGGIALSGGQITKDWVYVDDVVDGYLRALESSFVGAINIGSGQETSLAAIALQIAHALGTEVTEGQLPGGGITRMWADISRAKKVLGWEPKVSLEEGLERTIEWWNNHR